MIEKVITILRALMAQPTVTRRALAQKCECCTKTVSRIIDALTCSGFDIVTKCGVGGGVSLRDREISLYIGRRSGSVKRA